MISEVYPQSIRTKAVALSVQLNFALNAIVQFVVPILQQKIGLPNLFFIFSLLSGYSIYFIYYKIIETKGLSLEQIEHQFQIQFQNQNQQQTNSKNCHNDTEQQQQQQQQQQRRGWDNNNNDADEETIQLLHAS
jgi:major inositol transporter-like SP family MFS transporter